MNQPKNPFPRRAWERGTLLFLLLLAIFTGCGPQRPATAPVSGRVTFNGKPIATGQIVFYPDNGRTAMSPIDAEGRYRLTTFKPGDGALLGHHRVTIEAVRVTNAGNMPKTIEEEMQGHGFAGNTEAKVEWIVPERYSQLQTTPLTADIASGDNGVNFDLPK
jgi:hypothetical protein